MATAGEILARTLLRRGYLVSATIDAWETTSYHGQNAHERMAMATDPVRHGGNSGRATWALTPHGCCYTTGKGPAG